MRGLTLGHIAEANAEKYPDDTCLVVEAAAGDEELTFEEFDAHLDRVAHLLRDYGVEEGDRVGVYMQNNAETLETYFGAMKLGALPVPVNHRFKDREVEYVLSDSGAELIVFDEEAADTVATLAGDSHIEEFLYVGEEVPEFADDYHAVRDSASAESVDIVPDRLDDAALMYTSGTTGKPKGCVLTHDNIIQNAVNLAYSAQLQENEGRFLLVTPLFHIAAFSMFVNTLYTGSTSYLVDDFDPVRTLEIVEEADITGSFVVPMMSRAMLEVDGFEEYDLSSFRHYMTGGAPSGRELKERVVDAFGAGLYDLFGQTEMSPITTILKAEDALDKPDSLGRPIINVSLKVVDDDGNRVEQGEIGRAAYRGPTAFRKYLGMPEKTAEVFDDEGYFVSGDLVWRDEDGFVYFVGRHDDMIVSGGENIHPAEIEEVLHEHDAISQAAIVGVPDEKWGERVKAAVVTVDGATLTAEEVTAFVEERLAGFKKPREVVFLDELPRNPTGKVLKSELQ